jgi:hypothetical protein
VDCAISNEKSVLNTKNPTFLELTQRTRSAGQLHDHAAVVSDFMLGRTEEAEIAFRRVRSSVQTAVFWCLFSIRIQIADRVIDVLARPRPIHAVRAQARRTDTDRYDLAGICVP